jgi:molybdenum-dependent DNA-binding transcriptional regulator ModE
MRVELNLVEIFCRVVDEGSFSRAAEKLRLSQPTVSGHVRNLEGLIGMKLLDRLPRGIALTPAGKLLYKHGTAIRNEKDSAIRALKQLLNSEQGELLLSGSTIPAEYILPPIIASFRAEFPSIKVEIRISDSEHVQTFWPGVRSWDLSAPPSAQRTSSSGTSAGTNWRSWSPTRGSGAAWNRSDWMNWPGSPFSPASPVQAPEKLSSTYSGMLSTGSMSSAVSVPPAQ